MVPLGLFHISLSLNSFTRASSGVIVAHLMPTLCFRIASAASTVTLSLVYNEEGIYALVKAKPNVTQIERVPRLCTRGRGRSI